MPLSFEYGSSILPSVDNRNFPVVIIGAGQAGLATSYLLSKASIKHIILERHEIGWEWKQRRWDSFCLVTPNWQCQLPGFVYDGADPDGFMLKDEVVAYLQDYARIVNPPLVQGVTVEKLSTKGAGFELSSDTGRFFASQVVVATGPYHSPVFPALAHKIPSSITQLHSSNYRCADLLPKGDVLVVGTGQSGSQIAEDLHISGRKVHLCVGGAPRVARRYRGKDVVAWLDQMGYYEKTIDEHPLGQGARQNVNHYVTGRDGGRDIDLRKFALEGMQLYGRLEEVDSTGLRFGNDLEKNLDHADSVSEGIKDFIDEYIIQNYIQAPLEARYIPVWKPKDAKQRLDFESANITSVIWATGFNPDYRWIDLPIFLDNGLPVHQRGITEIPGLYFIGLPWLYTWGSARFSGVAKDAEHIVGTIESFYYNTTASQVFA